MVQPNHVLVALGGKIYRIRQAQWKKLWEKIKGLSTIRERGAVAYQYLKEEGVIQ